ncbi:hypothetical protein V7S57_01765 [Caulobacter sp. CCNWLY153]|uniref:hypothetical protein n=1 Tax=unclassified Caulobacter TaxID=2648921 RepID=UPI002FF31812
MSAFDVEPIAASAAFLAVSERCKPGGEHMSFFDDAISNLGRGLAQSAVSAISDATGYDVGSALKSLFGGAQTKGGEDLAQLQQALPSDWSGSADQLLMLTNNITQQQGAIQDLGSQLSSLSNSIGGISTRIANIESLLQKLNQEQLFQEWATADNSLQPYAIKTGTAHTQYAAYIDEYDSTPTDMISDLVENVLDLNSGPAASLDIIHQAIQSQEQQRGVLELWSSMVAPLVSAGYIDYRHAVSQYMNYYKKLALAQLQATNLLMEAYNYEGSKLAPQAWSQYKGYLLAQETTFITWLYPLVAAGVWLVPKARVTFSAALAATDLDPGLQSLQPSTGQYGPGYYQPSMLFAKAEQMLATLYVNGEADRRVVIHLAYEAEQYISQLVGGAVLTLTPQPEGDVVKPTSSDLLPLKFHAQPRVDDNYSGDFYVRRFVFQSDTNDAALADGEYNITDINGHHGLVPMEAYMGGIYLPAKFPFMRDAVLQYGLSVSQASPFDFMNFFAYMTPFPWPAYCDS